MSLIRAPAWFAFVASPLLAPPGGDSRACAGAGGRAHGHAVGFYDVQEIPLTLSDATLYRDSDGYILKCSAANRSAERIMGARFIILIVGRAGKLRSRSGLMERVALEGCTAKEFSLRLLAKPGTEAGDRIVLAVEQVIGRESIWKVVNAKEAFASYATNSDFVTPDVRRVSNQREFVPGIRMLN